VSTVEAITAAIVNYLPNKLLAYGRGWTNGPKPRIESTSLQNSSRYVYPSRPDS
jgi:hypothetical protein